MLPDLVIEAVTYVRVPESGSGAEPEGTRLEYTLKIRNTGNTDASGNLYYGYALRRSGVSFTDEDFSSGGLLAGNVMIRANEAMTATCTGSVSYNSTEPVGFWINPNTGKYRDVIPYLEERDFDNNRYELTISWPVPEKITESVQEEETLAITRFTAENTQYLLTLEPLKYSAEELKSRVLSFQQLDDTALSEQILDRCLEAVSDYVYAFPGYEYGYLSVDAGLSVIEPGIISCEIEVNGRGLDKGTITYDGTMDVNDGDQYQFALTYNEATAECELQSHIISGIVIPAAARRNAIMLLKECPLCDEYIDDDISDTPYVFVWYDSVRGKYAKNYEEKLAVLDFNGPETCVLGFLMMNSQYDLFGFIDLYSGEIVCIGPRRLQF